MFWIFLQHFWPCGMVQCMWQPELTMEYGFGRSAWPCPLWSFLHLIHVEAPNENDKKANSEVLKKHTIQRIQVMDYLEIWIQSLKIQKLIKPNSHNTSKFLLSQLTPEQP